MANKVAIFIKNTEGVHIELTNSKMALLVASSKDYNWESIFGEKIPEHSIILADWSENVQGNPKSDYCLVEECDNKEVAERIILDCRKLLNEQFGRMMSIRVMKKYHLDDNLLLNLEMEYHDPKNFEIDLKSYFKEGELL